MEPSIPFRLRDAFTTRESSGAAAIVRSDFAEAFDRLRLIGAADRTAEEIVQAAERALEEAPEATDAPETTDAPAPRLLHVAGGRGALVWLPVGDGPGAVVRPFRRGGLPAQLTERRYMLGHRAFRELIVTEDLHRAGAPVPLPLAAVQSRAAIGYRAALVTRYVPDADAAPGLLRDRDAPACRSVLRRMGRGAGRLHAAGGWHADMNATNFLVPDDGDAIITDLDRGRVLSSPLPWLLARWNLRRLRRSLRKLELGAALRAWHAFEEGWERGLEGG